MFLIGFLSKRKLKLNNFEVNVYVLFNPSINRWVADCPFIDVDKHYENYQTLVADIETKIQKEYESINCGKTMCLKINFIKDEFVADPCLIG